MRDILDKSLKDAMRARDTQKISTIRLINAAIKDRDIAIRSEDNLEGVSDEEILSILEKNGFIVEEEIDKIYIRKE